ncbi:MAG: hypothetical protein AB7P61_07595 [Gemmatimonadales bacterium]
MPETLPWLLRDALLYLLRENRDDRRNYPGMDTHEVDELLARLESEAPDGE